MPLPLALIPAIKLIATGVALGVVAYQLNKTYEGQAIKLWFDKVVKGRAPETPEGVNDFLKKYYGVDLEAITTILVQMKAIIDSTNKVLKSDKEVYYLIKQALKESKVKYSEKEGKNIIAVILSIYQTLRPSESGAVYNYIRGGKTPTERKIETFKKDVVKTVTPPLGIKKYFVIGGIAIAGFLFWKYGMPALKKVGK